MSDVISFERVQMAQVIAGLLQGQTIRQVAESTGISRDRIARWYRSSAEFEEMLLDTTDEVVEMIRADIKADARDAVVNLLPRAKEVLGEMLESEKDSVRLSAANAVFRLAGYGNEKQPIGRGVGAPDVTPPRSANPAAGD